MVVRTMCREVRTYPLLPGHCALARTPPLFEPLAPLLGEEEIRHLLSDPSGVQIIINLSIGGAGAAAWRHSHSHLSRLPSRCLVDSVTA